MSEANEGPKFCAKCKLENCIYFTFVEDFMLSKAWDVKKLKVNVTACFSELFIEQSIDPEQNCIENMILSDNYYN